MKKYLVCIIFLLGVLVGTSFAAQVPTMQSIPRSDTIPPELTITAPNDGSTVSGLLTISATASDNVAITKVDYCVEFPNNIDYYCFPSDTSAPYEVSKDSRAFPNGYNRIKVIAYDAANNTTNRYVTVSINNEGTEPPPTVKNIYLDNGGPGDGSIGNPYGKFSEIPWSSITSWVAAGYSVNINLKSGVTWREKLIVGASGRPTNRIIIKPYGAGTDPVIDGQNSDTTVRVVDQSYVTLEGLEITYGNWFNVLFGSNGYGNIIQDCKVHNSYKANIFASNQHDLIIKRNRIHGARSEHGIYLDGSLYGGGGNGVYDTIIEYNDIYDNQQMGIQFQAGANAGGGSFVTRTIVRYNRIRDNKDGFGIHANGDRYSKIYGNLIYNNGNRAVALSFNAYEDPHALYPSQDSEIYNNTIYQSNGNQAFFLYTNTTNNIIKNNIISTHYAAFYYIVEDSDAIFNNNLFDRIDGHPDDFAVINVSTRVSSFAAWKSGYNQDINSREQSAVFNNPATYDFTLKSTSPARTGAESSQEAQARLGYSQRLSPLSSWPDNVILIPDSKSIGAYGY